MTGLGGPRNLKRTTPAVCLVSIYVFGSGYVLAQSAQITGRVTDSTGAVVPGAGITVHNVATGVDRSASTNQDGYYTVPLLQPAEYRVMVEHRGFKPVTRSGVVLEVDQRAELNFAL